MKDKCLLKGIITAAFFLCICFITLLSKPALTAQAGTPEPKLNVKSKAIVKGKDYALKVYNLSETQSVTFTSDAPKIASVDEEGVVYGHAIGSAVIQVSITDSKSDQTIKLQCKVTVGPPALFVLLARKNVELVIGQRSMLFWLVSPLNTAEQPKFFSSAPEVASVSAGGVITAKSEGVSYIFAQIDNGMFDFCKISVSAEGAKVDEVDEDDMSDVSFAEFLLRLNEGITNGDNTSENTTGAESAQ